MLPKGELGFNAQRAALAKVAEAPAAANYAQAMQAANGLLGGAMQNLNTLGQTGGVRMNMEDMAAAIRAYGEANPVAQRDPNSTAIGANNVDYSKFTPKDEMSRLIIETAQDIGADPLDLATAISYETAGTFDPRKAGPTTQWGQHRGLIQFGEPQAQEYGVNWDDPLYSQLGKGKAVSNYFKKNGFRAGMSGLDLYSTINAGGPGRYTASDANNGGAPGDVRDKWENQMGDHRRKAMAILGLV